MTGNNDLQFLKEGQRTIAVSRFHVLEESVGGEEEYDWEIRIAHLMSQDECDTRSLVLLINHMKGDKRGLDQVRDFVNSNLIQPI